ncbi:hypothetical protein H696_00390 [Fonticula alba]|uniref:EF-hand domain-containing protein n=1 Tax=Fonticula alba TaxID=691883 RepID=A0A058ZH52_FONAL|nr:hypothetical protein H696_00390 [Fonticula alba]KCV72812.1 hypothetical protein H696_00390 [Fonticula alba]|eukprot:XP_009492513.1 hypothetical protein H696_00390 [Fonticula alba]
MAYRFVPGDHLGPYLDHSEFASIVSSIPGPWAFRKLAQRVINPSPTQSLASSSLDSTNAPLPPFIRLLYNQCQLIARGSAIVAITAAAVKAQAAAGSGGLGLGSMAGAALPSPHIGDASPSLFGATCGGDLSSASPAVGTCPGAGIGSGLLSSAAALQHIDPQALQAASPLELAEAVARLVFAALVETPAGPGPGAGEAAEDTVNPRHSFGIVGDSPPLEAAPGTGSSPEAEAEAAQQLRLPTNSPDIKASASVPVGVSSSCSPSGPGSASAAAGQHPSTWALLELAEKIASVALGQKLISLDDILTVPVTLPVVMHVLATMCRETPERRLQFYFRAFDRDHDGWLTLSELTESQNTLILIFENQPLSDQYSLSDDESLLKSLTNFVQNTLGKSVFQQNYRIHLNDVCQEAQVLLPFFRREAAFPLR